MEVKGLPVRQDLTLCYWSSFPGLFLRPYWERSFLLTPCPKIAAIKLCYLIFFAAQSFFACFRGSQEDYHEEDLSKLAAITRREHMKSNELMGTLRYWNRLCANPSKKLICNPRLSIPKLFTYIQPTNCFFSVTTIT